MVVSRECPTINRRRRPGLLHIAASATFDACSITDARRLLGSQVATSRDAHRSDLANGFGFQVPPSRRSSQVVPLLDGLTALCRARCSMLGSRRIRVAIAITLSSDVNQLPFRRGRLATSKSTDVSPPARSFNFHSSLPNSDVPIAEGKVLGSHRRHTLPGRNASSKNSFVRAAARRSTVCNSTSQWSGIDTRYLAVSAKASSRLVSLALAPPRRVTRGPSVWTEIRGCLASAASRDHFSVVDPTSLPFDVYI